MSEKQSKMEAGDQANEDENGIPLKTLDGPPPSFDTAMESQDDTEEDEVDENSKALLQGEVDNGAASRLSTGSDEMSSEEKKIEHERKIKKLMADLRRECSVQEVAPEEIEMLNVGDDDLTESEMSSVPSSARDRRDPLLGAAAVATEEEVHEATMDTTDVSLSRLSRRLSLLMATADHGANRESDDKNVNHPPANGGTDDNNVDFQPDDEVSVETGERCRKGSGLFARLQGSPTRILIVLFTIIFCLGLLLLVILLPKSFVYVEYHQYALSKNSVTETVDYDTVYDGGCYLLAPQDELIRFDATAHFVEKSLYISESTGLSIKLDISLQYFLKRDEVPQMFKKYYHHYHEVIESLVESAVKNAAAAFSLDQYRLSRQEVEGKIFGKISESLAGDCCDACCPDKCGEKKVDCGRSACLPVGSCHPGHHVDIKYFQLGAIVIPETVIDRHIQTIVLQVEADRELFYQKRAVEVKKTVREAQNIKNQAREQVQGAVAQAKVIRAKAESEKFAKLEKARQQALRNVFSSFNITREDVKLSYIYTHALATMGDNLRYSYGYEGLSAFLP